MSTNGLMLERYATALKEAGLKRLNVSLDTLDRATFHRVTGVDALDRVLDGIEAAVHAGFAPIKLNVVVQRGINDEECAVLARMTLRHSYHVRFIEYMPVVDYDDWTPRHVTNADVMEKIRRELGTLRPCPSSQQDGPAREYQLEGGVGRMGFISAITDKHFCGRCNRLRLTARGTLRPCLFSSAEVDLRPALRAGCADADLHDLFDRALGVKPRSHELSAQPRKHMLPTMIDLGG